jgi:hypothetical protein
MQGYPVNAAYYGVAPQQFSQRQTAAACCGRSELEIENDAQCRVNSVHLVETEEPNALA